ncbi:chromate transporter [soil metagenome]
MNGSLLQALGSPLDAAALFALFVHFALLSLLAIGGAISAAPDMHRFVVDEHHWITDAQFTASVALAQAAPGPNVLFVAVIGWNVAGPLGALACMLGILIPSTTLALWATRWGHARRDTLAVRAFTLGLAPITVGLMLATGWILAEPSRHMWGSMVLVIVTVVVSMRTRLSPVVMIAIGAIAGALGLA